LFEERVVNTSTNFIVNLTETMKRYLDVLRLTHEY